MPQPPSSAPPLAERSTPDVRPLEAFSTDPEDLVGRLLDGRYLIEAVLGRGAMAVVLGGLHVFLGRRVAIKVLHPALLALDEMRARFLREARAAGRIQHEAVVAVTDFGVAPTPAGQLHYLVMEQLEGEDLLAWSERRGPADLDALVAIGAQLADALAAIHDAGYVHRDVKPENVWVMNPGEPLPRIKLLDLGIAAVIDEREGEPERPGRGRGHRLTRAGQTLGTVLYMSPEQAMGLPLDGRSDVYSLGCVLWEVACDACVFDGTSPMAIMLKQTATEAPPPSSVNRALPPWFDAIVLRCLAKEPDDRFASAAAVRDALRAGPPLPGPERVPLLEAPAPVAATGSFAPVVLEPLAPEPFASLEDAPRRAGWIAAGALALVGVVALLVASPWSSPAPAATAPALPIVAAPPTSAPPSSPSSPSYPGPELAAPEPGPAAPAPATVAEPGPAAPAPSPAAASPEPSPTPTATPTRPTRTTRGAAPASRDAAPAPAAASPTPATPVEVMRPSDTPPATAPKPKDSELWRPEKPSGAP